jgi:hypothetical protein
LARTADPCHIGQQEQSHSEADNDNSTCRFSIKTLSELWFFVDVLAAMSTTPYHENPQFGATAKKMLSSMSGVLTKQSWC